jgi:hypothetical protein
MCGPFKAVGTSLATRLGDDTAQLSPIQRAALAHRVRSAKDAGGEPPLITSDWLERFLQNARLPSPSEQAIGIIRLIGENVENTGKPLRQLPPHLWTSIGSPNPPFALNIAFELHTKVIGDFCSHDWRLGDGWAAILLSAVLFALFLAGRNLLLWSLPFYWLIIVMIRAAGTVVGDFFAGRNMLGLPLSTLVTGLLFIGLLIVWKEPFKKRQELGAATKA